MNMHRSDAEEGPHQSAESDHINHNETASSEDAEMERIRARYLKRIRIGLVLGIGLIVLLAYVLRP